MITHLVLFKPSTSLEPAQRRALLDGVIQGVRRCPTVRGCRIGRRIRHGRSGYEQAMVEDYAYALFLEFDSVEGLTDYLNDPEHARLAGYFAASAAALAYDYEVVAPDSALQLLGDPAGR